MRYNIRIIHKATSIRGLGVWWTPARLLGSGPSTVSVIRSSEHRADFRLSRFLMVTCGGWESAAHGAVKILGQWKLVIIRDIRSLSFSPGSFCMHFGIPAL